MFEYVLKSSEIVSTTPGLHIDSQRCCEYVYVDPFVELVN